MFKNKRNVLIASVLAGAAIAGAGIGVAVYMKNKKSKPVVPPSNMPCGMAELVSMKINDSPVVSTSNGGSVSVNQETKTVTIIVPSMTINIAKDGDMVMSTTIPDCVAPKTEIVQVLDNSQIDYPIVKAGLASVVAKITPASGNSTRLYFYLSINDEEGQQDITGTDGYGAGTWGLVTPFTITWNY